MEKLDSVEISNRRAAAEIAKMNAEITKMIQDSIIEYKRLNTEGLQMAAEREKMEAEREKMAAEREKMAAERAKIERETAWHPLAAGALAMGLVIGGIAAVLRFFTFVPS